jgi:enhancing lycopene biosynthesis protein 2
MAFIYFTEGPNSELFPVNLFPDSNPFDGEELPNGDYCIEYDYDKTAEELDSLKLNSDKTAVVNRFPGKTLEEQRVLLVEEAEVYRRDQNRKDKVNRIKSLIADVIEPVEWRAERAKDLDNLEGENVTTRQTKVAAYRKAARDANNAHEALLNSLTTDEEVTAFDPNWVPAFLAANPIDF